MKTGNVWMGDGRPNYFHQEKQQQQKREHSLLKLLLTFAKVEILAQAVPPDREKRRTNSEG